MTPIDASGIGEPPAGAWTGPRPWVGREALLQSLAAALTGGLERGGGVVFLEGPPGSGRTSLLHRSANAAMHGGRAASAAYGDAADPAASAWEQIAGRLTRRDRIGKVVKRSAAGWIGLVPLVGGVLEAAIETGQALAGEEDDDAERGSTAIGHVRMLLAMGADRPRIVLLDNVDAGDSEEFAGAFALVRRLRGNPMVLVMTSDTDAGGRAHDLLLESDRLGLTSRHRIPPFPLEDALTALQRSTGSAPPAVWTEWWRTRLDGTPGSLWRTLGAVRAAGGLVSRRGRWVWAPEPPERLTAAPPARAARLPDVSASERKVLAAAAGVGERFSAPGLAERLGEGVETVEAGLEALARRGLIDLVDTIEDGADLVDVFEFADPPGRAAWEHMARDPSRPGARFGDSL
jgi:hypothetical protein